LGAARFRRFPASARTSRVAFMSPLVSEDGVRVPDAVQHDAPHALCNPLGGYRRVVVLR
jgi:hypothetical protein